MSSRKTQTATQRMREEAERRAQQQPRGHAGGVGAQSWSSPGSIQHTNSFQSTSTASLFQSPKTSYQGSLRQSNSYPQQQQQLEGTASSNHPTLDSNSNNAYSNTNFNSSNNGYPTTPAQSTTNPNQSQPQQQQQQQYSSSTSTNPQHHSRNYYEGTPASTTTAPSSQSNNNSDDAAAIARTEWRTHGRAKTQALEELRSNSTVVVRVVGAEARVDVTGADYTVYVIEVVTKNNHNHNSNNSNTPTILCRRYSDFLKLHTTLQQQQQQQSSQSLSYTKYMKANDAAFPPRHWAGRVGAWTPSAVWAPASHDALVQSRVVQLDVWLVHVVALQQQQEQHAVDDTAASAVWNFLTATAPTLPCQADNSVDRRRPHDWNNPVTFTLGSAVRQATKTVQAMTSTVVSSTAIPLDLLQQARGLVFLTVWKAGLVVSGRVGTGLMVAKLPDGQWSAPAALGTVGVGWGAVIGSDVTHYLVVLVTEEAVQHFGASTVGAVTLGAELGLAVGPVGRSASQTVQSADWSMNPAYAYAHSQGLFLGVSLEGSVVAVRKDVNAKFYGKAVALAELLKHPGRQYVKAAEPLYNALDEALQQEIPEHAFRPSRLWNKSSEAGAVLDDTAGSPFGQSQYDPMETGHRSNNWNDGLQQAGATAIASSFIQSAVGTRTQQGNNQHRHEQSLM